MANRPVVLAGAAVAGGIGYYFYKAGGDPKLAEKTFEKDAASATASVKSHIPGTEKVIKEDAKVTGAKIGKAYDDAVSSAKDKTHKVDAKLESYRADAGKKLQEVRSETGTQLSKAVDNFDKSVEKGAAQSKSWISGWFGGK